MLTLHYLWYRSIPFAPGDESSSFSNFRGGFRISHRGYQAALNAPPPPKSDNESPVLVYSNVYFQESLLTHNKTNNSGADPVKVVDPYGLERGTNFLKTRVQLKTSKRAFQ